MGSEKFRQRDVGRGHTIEVGDPECGADDRAISQGTLTLA